jgi:hypothetical protein
VIKGFYEEFSSTVCAFRASDNWFGNTAESNRFEFDWIAKPDADSNTVTDNLAGTDIGAR